MKQTFLISRGRFFSFRIFDSGMLPLYWQQTSVG